MVDRRPSRLRLVAAGLLLLASCGGEPVEPLELPQIEWAPRGYVCYRTDEALAVDGRLDEPVWRRATWTESFVDIRGETHPAPRFETRAAMLWDDEFFYVAAQLEEPHVWATLRERDSVIFHDNDFEVFIDPDGDTHDYYELEINALGTEWDLMLTRPYRDQGDAIDEWDIAGLVTGVHVEGSINNPADEDLAWTIEIAFPWAALAPRANRPAPPVAGDRWRVNFSRVEWPVDAGGAGYSKRTDPATGKPLPEDNWVWSPQGLIAMHYPELWGFVQFSEHVAGRGEDAFVADPLEPAKWALRRVYYAQDHHRALHGRFTDDPRALGVSDMQPVGYAWPPSIRLDDEGYTASITGDDGTVVRIRRDGRVW